MNNPLSQFKSPLSNGVAFADQASTLVQPQVRSPLSMPAVSGQMPTVVAAVQLSRIPISMDDVDILGEDVSKAIGMTTDKIIKKMAVNSFDELGQILTTIQVESAKLDPASYKKKGILGWLQNRFTNVKKELTLQFKTAEQVFDKLEQQISNHMAVHQEWIRDLETLYAENYSRYQQLLNVLATCDRWKQEVAEKLKTWPAINPDDIDAPMKLQERRDAERLLNRIEVKADYFLRLKTVMENHSLRIRDQQDTSRVTIGTLKDVVEQAIPAIKSEFTLFLQTLDSKKSDELINNLRGLVNTSMQKSADSAKDAAIASATSANTPQISTDTLKHIRERMLETATTVQGIYSTARTQREEDAKYITESQKEYYKQCSQLGLIK